MCLRSALASDIGRGPLAFLALLCPPNIPVGPRRACCLHKFRRFIAVYRDKQIDGVVDDQSPAFEIATRKPISAGLHKYSH